MKKSPIMHKWQAARVCDKCGYMSNGWDFTTVGTTVKDGRVLTVQACPNCANIGDDDQQQRLVRLVEYTLLHKILSWLSGHGWPLNRWDMKEYKE